MRVRHPSDTNDAKDNIQALLREIVIIRDGGCILRDMPDGVPACNGHAKDGHLILQFDHLVTRGNSATFSDTRLGVCICIGHHGWKKWNEARYNEIVRVLLPSDRVALWDKANAARYQALRKYTYDWRMDEAALKQELAEMQRSHPKETAIEY